MIASGKNAFLQLRIVYPWMVNFYDKYICLWRYSSCFSDFRTSTAGKYDLGSNFFAHRRRLRIKRNTAVIENDSSLAATACRALYWSTRIRCFLHGGQYPSCFAADTCEPPFSQTSGTAPAVRSLQSYRRACALPLRLAVHQTRKCTWLYP